MTLKLLLHLHIVVELREIWTGLEHVDDEFAGFFGVEHKLSVVESDVQIWPQEHHVAQVVQEIVWVQCQVGIIDRHQILPKPFAFMKPGAAGNAALPCLHGG
jgi:hypothetical protein